jgi:hypothetical protein
MTRKGPWTAYECDDFIFELDEYSDATKQMIFGHVFFYKFTPAAMKHCIEVYKTFRQTVDCPIYAYGEEDTPKYARFVGHLGFTPVSSITCVNGEQRTLYISLKDPHVTREECRHDCGDEQTEV